MSEGASSPGAAPRNGALSPIEWQVLDALRSIRFGTVEITIHESRVVQIERREKVRVGRDGE